MANAYSPVLSSKNTSPLVVCLYSPFFTSSIDIPQFKLTFCNLSHVQLSEQVGENEPFASPKLELHLKFHLKLRKSSGNKGGRRSLVERRQETASEKFCAGLGSDLIKSD